MYSHMGYLLSRVHLTLYSEGPIKAGWLSLRDILANERRTLSVAKVYRYHEGYRIQCNVNQCDLISHQVHISIEFGQYTVTSNYDIYDQIIELNI